MAISGMGRVGQMTMAGNPTTGSSLNVAIVSRGHVAGALDGPFVVLFEEDGADEPDEGVVVCRPVRPPRGAADVKWRAKATDSVEY
jgi:hypothetical protein